VQVYSIFEILWWIVKGRLARWHRQLNLPDWLWPYFPDDPPGFVSDLNYDTEYRDWCHSYAPSSTCAYYVGDAATKAFEAWLDDLIQDARDSIERWTRAITGYIPDAYDSIANWISSTKELIGNNLPQWAYTVAAGLGWLHDKFPQSIRDGWKTWTEIWDQIEDNVAQWARDRYDAAKDWASSAWGWVQDAGSTLKGWYDTASDWLDDFRQNASERVRGWLGDAWDWLVRFWNDPYGTIATTLGQTWDDLVIFRDDALSFWYNLWGSHASEIGEFWEDPLQWLWDKAEDWILDNVW
jgi:hypothetical protein